MNVIEIDITDDNYPEKLRLIHNPPKKLYCRGNVKFLKNEGIGICGSRKCSPYGVAVTKNIASRCTKSDLIVISGMADGIDTVAHKETLENNGKTIAVLGCGPDICYPAKNKLIMEKIIKSGLVVSEYPPGTKAKPYHFPARNRIISGLSKALVVTEARERSGALITAEFAIDQGKQVYSIPGNINSPYSFGTNKLILDGANPLVIIEDLFRDLGFNLQLNKDDKVVLDEDEKLIYSLILNGGELSVEELCNLSLFSPQKLNGIITVLEMKGLVVSTMGKVFIQ